MKSKKKFRQGRPENADGVKGSTYKMYAYGFNRNLLFLEFSRDSAQYAKEGNLDKAYNQLKNDFLSGKFCDLSLVMFAKTAYAEYDGEALECWNAKQGFTKYNAPQVVSSQSTVKKLLTHAINNFRHIERDIAILSMCITLKPEYLKEWHTITRYNFPMFKSVGDGGLRENALSILYAIALQYADIADTALVSNNGTNLPLYRIDLSSGKVYYSGSLQQVLYVV